ncbi:MAG: hypothetical protein ACJAT1_001686 [Marivirga sp.]|jgi:hypothetical protein
MQYFIKILTIMLFLFAAQLSYAQTVENIKLDFDGDRMKITYDLVASTTNEKYNITLYSSYDNFQKPLFSVTGDVGDNVPVGRQKSVSWNLKQELPADFNDEIAIKVKATEMAGAYKLQPLANSFKRGKALQLLWEGGSPNDQVKIDLLRNKVFQQTITQTKNNKSHTWNIPKDFEKGDGYTLRLTSVSDADQSMNSTSFQIKSKMPLLLKIAPVVLVGVLVGVLSGGGDPPVSNELPGPINP